MAVDGRIFISFSGPRGSKMAHAVQEWIARVFKADVFVARQLPAGEPWFEALATALRQSSVAILCITSESRRSPWIHFEAGAAFKDESRIIPYLLDLREDRLKEPLGAFQARRADRAGTLGMLQEMGLEVDLVLFEREWPTLQRSFDRLRRQATRRRYGPWAAVAAVLAGVALWLGHLMNHSVFPDFQPALPHLNTSNGGPLRVVRWNCARNPQSCPRGYTHTFETSLTGGYATLWLDKVITSADLQARDILLSVMFRQGARDLEIGITDGTSNRSFFDCHSDEPAATFVVSLRQDELSRARCRTNVAAIQHFSIGYTQQKPGEHRFELLDLRVTPNDARPGGRACVLRRCAD